MKSHSFSFLVAKFVFVISTHCGWKFSAIWPGSASTATTERYETGGKKLMELFYLNRLVGGRKLFPLAYLPLAFRITRICACVCFRFRDTRCHRTASDTVCARFIDKYLQLEALCDHIYVILIIMCATTKHLACVRTSHRKAERVLRECRMWRCDCEAVARTLCPMPHRCASDASVSILRIGTCKSHFSIVLSSFMRNK